ncbi:hypothetical protein HispidOSU_027276, partial [Sigmodon hispidus]
GKGRDEPAGECRALQSGPRTDRNEHVLDSQGRYGLCDRDLRLQSHSQAEAEQPRAAPGTLDSS